MFWEIGIFLILAVVLLSIFSALYERQKQVINELTLRQADLLESKLRMREYREGKRAVTWVTTTPSAGQLLFEERYEEI